MANITPYLSRVAMADRLRISHSRPVVFWMTGLSGSGKSTIASAFEAMCISEGHAAFMLDGDTVRTGLCAGLGFSPEDRAENLRRIAETAKIAASSGQIVVVCAISPDRQSRDRAREIISPAADFFEVYVSTPVEECARRDPKGLYKKAYAGEIPSFTGVSAPYEVPEKPDIVLDTVNGSVTDCAKLLFDRAMDCVYRPSFLLNEMAKAAAKAASAILEIYNGQYEVSFKEDASPLTTADTASNTVITGHFRSVFPEYDILTEEEDDSDRDAHGIPKRLNGCGTFIIDPLDGTKEFINRNGEFCVSIGFADHHRVMAGAVAVPARGLLYYAYEGKGAYKTVITGDMAENGIPSLFDPAERIHVSDRVNDLRITASRSHGDKQTEALLEINRDRIGDVLTAGSCLKGCLIAEGEADIHYRWGAFMKEWDTAGMEILCREAGASFTDINGSPLCANRADPVNRNGFRILNRPEAALDTKDIK
ncbi:MAG: adenylyl-sulfate kinase [Clostridia bacterium]|nr:adenylyl-sulfate kinase [Clostridia bacterium]